MFELMHIHVRLSRVKRSDIDFCADKYNLIVLSDFIGFGYDLSDTQDGLEYMRM